MRIKYLGFDEEKLLAAAKDLEAIGLRPSEVHAAMNLAGAKWRSVQRREGRKDETHEEGSGRVFQEATQQIMQATMTNAIILGKLGHAAEGEGLMFVAISVTLNKLFLRGPRLIKDWLEEGDPESRRIVLSFAIGSCIIVNAEGIDIFFDRIVRSRYGFPFDSGKDVSEAVLDVIGRLGKAGYEILNAVSDSI